MDFYQFFSFSAKKAIYRANEIAAQFSNQYLEPEHIFYSTLNLRSCSAVQVLHTLEVHLPKLTYSLEAHLYGHAASYKGTASFSRRTIELLSEAMKEIKRLHHREIGTTHLLIALAQDRAPFLRELMADHKLDAKRIRNAFITHLKGYSHTAWTGPVRIPEAPWTPPKPSPESGYSKMLSPPLRDAMQQASSLTQALGHEYVQPEHLACALLQDPAAFTDTGIETGQWNRGALLVRLMQHLGEKATTPMARPPQPGRRLISILSAAYGSIIKLGTVEIAVGNVFAAMLEEQDSFVSRLFHNAGIYDAPEEEAELDSGQSGDGDDIEPPDDDDGAEAE